MKCSPQTRSFKRIDRSDLQGAASVANPTTSCGIRITSRDTQHVSKPHHDRTIAIVGFAALTATLLGRRGDRVTTLTRATTKVMLTSDTRAATSLRADCGCTSLFRDSHDQEAVRRHAGRLHRHRRRLRRIPVRQALEDHARPIQHAGMRRHAESGVTGRVTALIVVPLRMPHPRFDRGQTRARAAGSR